MPFACESHWIWALYLPPILIVAGAIAATKLKQRKDDRRTY